MYQRVDIICEHNFIGHFSSFYDCLCTSNPDNHEFADDVEIAIDTLDYIINCQNREQYQVTELGRLRRRYSALYQRLLSPSICSLEAVGISGASRQERNVSIGRPKIAIKLDHVAEHMVHTVAHTIWIQNARNCQCIAN